ncbi:MAG TPA: RHS repeat-associated core domain-containing protein, partial [Caldisericia bacterium]|nr:RHS repeat-associated core domain-containing protein [Caldisericia bacterium]
MLRSPRESPPPRNRKERPKVPLEITSSRTERSKTWIRPDGVRYIQSFPYPIHRRGKGGWEEIEDRVQAQSLMLNPPPPPTPLSTALYAAGSSFTNGGQGSSEVMTLYHYVSGGQTVQSSVYLRYPDLRDLIPPDATLTSVQLVSTHEDDLLSPFDVQAKAITSVWDPRTVSSQNLPTLSGAVSGTATWDLDTGTQRSLRSINITSLAQAWHQGTQNNFGVHLSIPVAAQSPNGVIQADLPLLLVKYTVVGIPGDPALGGSYYHDQITPPVLIPGRAVFVKRTGDVNNSIQSFLLLREERSTLTPYCQKVGGGDLWFPQPVPPPIYLDPVIPIGPIDKFHSTTFSESYAFPALNPPVSGNQDLTPNTALDVYLPSEDPDPVGLTLSPPGPQNYPFLHLSTQGSGIQPLVDISPLISTPVNQEEYPNYAADDWFFVLQPSSGRAALSSLPIAVTYPLPDPGVGGELENTKDIGIIGASFQDFSYIVNPKNGNFQITLGGNNFGLGLGGSGCLKESASLTVSVTGASNSGLSSVSDNRLIIPNPTQPGVPDEGVIMVASNGAQIRFAATWSDQSQQQTQYAASSLSDWSLYYHAQASIDYQYEVRSKTGDISYFYHGTDGYLRKITSAQGGELNYLRSSLEPEKLISIEDGNSARSIQFTWDAYDRLTMKQEWDDTTPGRAELYVYDQDDRLVEYENAFQESLFFEYDLADRLVAVKQAIPSSLGKGNRAFSTTLMPLVNFSYDPTSSSPVVTSVANSCEEEYFLVRDLEEQTSTVTDPLLRDTVFEYYHEGSLASILDPSLSVKAFFPDSERASTNVKRIRGCGAGEDSREQVFEYDEDRNLTSLTDADGYTSSWTYNSRNKPTSYTDREENTWEYEYTLDGDQIAKITDPLGRETVYSYAQDKKIQSISRPYLEGSPAVTSFTHDSYGYIDTVTDALNRVVDRDYDAWGRLMQVTDPAGRISAFTYDALSRPTEITVTVPQVGSKSIGLSYNAQGQLASITRPDESSTLYRYDACGRVSEAEDALGNITSYSYDAAGRLVEVEDPLGRTMSMQYDTLNRLIALTDPKEETTSYQYDTLGRLQQVTTPLGQVTKMRYDALNRLVELEDPLEGISSFVWNKEGFLTEMTNPRGATWNMNYNDAYQLVSVQGPLQTETSYEYYPFGGLKKATNALEQSVQYEYDAAYRLTKIKDIQLRETTLSYTERDQLSQITLPGNRSTQFWYDGFGNLVKRRNALNQEVEMEYDISNQLTAFIDELDQRTEYEYDLLGRLISSKSPLGYERFYTYDEVSNMTSFEDPLTHVTEWVYDARNQVEKMTDPLLLESNFDYDEKGRLTQVTDPLLRVHSFSYDELDRLSEVLTPEERSASYSYDAGGLLLERSRPATSQSLASVSSYSYDMLGRSTEVENPLGESTTLSWNVLSQLLSVTYPTEESVEYSYDAYQRLSTITASDQRSITMSYDSYDRLSEIEHSVTGSYEYSYDVLDRITQETSPDSLVTTLSYDAAGKVTEQIWNQQSTEFSYDADSRLTGIDAPGNRSYTLSYDAANRLLTETLPTTGAVDYLQDEGDRLTSQIYTLPGSLGKTPGANPARKPLEEKELSSASSSRKLFLTAYEYARLVIGWYLREGEVRQLQKAEGGQLKGKAWEAQVALLNWWRQALLTPITIASFSPVWDAGDRISEEEIVLGQQNQERNYTYDDDDQLLSAELPSGTYSYTYDERYNRLSQRIETLSTDTTDFYTYNVADQLVERVRKDTSTQNILEEESFSYNEVGELISRTLSIGQTDATTQYAYEVGGKLKQVTLPDSSTVTYAYDALGNRIRKLSSSLDIHYQYSQGACRREIHKDPATQNILRTITYHPWGMNISANQTSTDYYFITDFRGWVWGLTDDSGTLVESYNYDPFGRILAGSLLSHARFLSGAHEGQWDGDTGLYYLGARFYDPSLGRFIQEDAVEGSADLPASQNRYIYCQNDPVALIDPTGYSPENTGTPARFTPKNYSNIQSSEGGMNSCYME